MALKSLKFISAKTLLLLLFCSAGNAALGQDHTAFDSVFSKVFDRNLLPVKTKPFIKSRKPILIISSLNCSGCVKYFTGKQKEYVLLFILQNESLLEAERIKDKYMVYGKQVYFTTAEYVKTYKEALCQKSTPCCLNPGTAGLVFYDYAVLYRLTNGFTVDHTKLKAILKRSDQDGN